MIALSWHSARHGSRAANAFGLYFISSLVLVATTGLERFITAWYLAGRMRSLDEIVAGLLRHLPF